MKDELVIHTKPKSNISEDIRTIRTNLQFSAVDKKLKVILKRMEILEKLQMQQ